MSYSDEWRPDTKKTEKNDIPMSVSTLLDTLAAKPTTQTEKSTEQIEKPIIKPKIESKNKEKITPLKRKHKNVKKVNKKELLNKLKKIPGFKRYLEKLKQKKSRKAEEELKFIPKYKMKRMTPAEKISLRSVMVKEKEEQRRRLEDKNLVLRGFATEKVGATMSKRSAFDDLARQRLKKEISQKSDLAFMKREARLKRKLAIEASKPFVNSLPSRTKKSISKRITSKRIKRPNVPKRIISAQSRKVRKLQKQRRRSPNKPIKRKRSKGWFGQKQRHSVAAKKGTKSSIKRRNRLYKRITKKG